MTQQGDIALRQTVDGGDITLIDGFIEMSGGLETAVYLSLLGGNEQDEGRLNNPLQYWGNFIEDLPERQYRSRFQHLLASLPAVSSNLRRLEDAALLDLKWMLDTRVVTETFVTLALVSADRVQATIEINADEGRIRLEFWANWKAEL
jgi:phage gp46-like protein